MHGTLALRNLGRNVRRTVLTASTLVFGFVLSVFFAGFYDGMHHAMIDRGTRTFSGHLVIRGVDGDEAPRPVDFEAVKRALGQLHAPAHALPRASGEGMGSANGRAIGVQFVGLDPASERGHSRLLELLQAGQEVSEAEPNGAVLGPRLAESLGLALGDTFTLLTDAEDEDLGERKLVVRGLRQTGLPDVDAHRIDLPLATAQALLGFGASVTEVLVFFGDEAEGRRAAPDLRARLSSVALEVLPWNQALPALAGMVEMDDAGLSLFLGILYLIMGLGVLNAVLMSVMERLREFGVMLALGATPAQVVGLVVAETSALVAFALLIGLAIALPLNTWLAVHGLDLGAFMPPDYQLGGVALDPRIHFVTRPERVALAGLAVAAAAHVAALFPALKAAHARPVEVLGRASH